ncbi:hypothetical protein GCM10020221_18490 [Streptomyces thioluteus]|uniref:Uncharacterized protein n=1 Tax=Streptomyces thioluteus TaxID=66431 RepID=A0ABN3WNY3_STRTU
MVTVSSGLHLLGTVDPRDLQMDAGYRRWIAYGRSKSANLLFVHELARRLAADGSPLVAARGAPGVRGDEPPDGGGAHGGPPLGGAAGPRREPVSSRRARRPVPCRRCGRRRRRTSGRDEFFGPRVCSCGGGRRCGPSVPRGRGTTARARGLWAMSERLTGVSYGWPPRV